MTSGGVCRQSHHGVERREAFLLMPGVGCDHVGVAVYIREGILKLDGVGPVDNRLWRLLKMKN